MAILIVLVTLTLFASAFAQTGYVKTTYPPYAGLTDAYASTTGFRASATSKEAKTTNVSKTTKPPKTTKVPKATTTERLEPANWTTANILADGTTNGYFTTTYPPYTGLTDVYASTTGSPGNWTSLNKSSWAWETTTCQPTIHGIECVPDSVIGPCLSQGFYPSKYACEPVHQLCCVNIYETYGVLQCRNETTVSGRVFGTCDAGYSCVDGWCFSITPLE
jgi:hypothetical protein